MVTHSVCLLCSLVCGLAVGVSFSQDARKIKEFENSLSTVLQVKDSSIFKYNIEARLRFHKVPAVSVAVIEKGKIALAKAYGEADITSHRKADSTTLFQVASISKTINALGILKLVEEGKVTLDKDFREYIKDGSFRETEFSKREKITVANLLSHTGGINRDDYDKSVSYVKNKKLLPTITQIVKGEKPALGKGAFSIAKPNRSYQYSNQAVCITQKMLADLFDPDFNRLMTNLVLKPVKMSNSTFAIQLSNTEQKNLAKGYYLDLKETAPWIFPCQSQGGLVSNARDIAKATIAIQNSYNEKSNPFLKKETIQKMFTPQLADSIFYMGSIDVPYRNGLGVMLFEKGGVKYFTHAGNLDGYTSIFIGDYSGEVGAVILINSVNARIIPEILNSIATTYHWKGFATYTVKNSVFVSSSNFDKLIGVYEAVTGTHQYTIAEEANRLFITGSDDVEKELMYFSSETEAFILSRRTAFQFVKSSKGIELIVNNNGTLAGEFIKKETTNRKSKKQSQKKAIRNGH